MYNGREEREVQALAPGWSVKTEEVYSDVSPHDIYPPATRSAFKDFEGMSGWTHPSVRKSGTCMLVSILRQLWELFDKAAYIVPVNDDEESQSWSNYLLSFSCHSDSDTS